MSVTATQAWVSPCDRIRWTVRLQQEFRVQNGYGTHDYKTGDEVEIITFCWDSGSRSLVPDDYYTQTGIVKAKDPQYGSYTVDLPNGGRIYNASEKSMRPRGMLPLQPLR